MMSVHQDKDTSGQPQQLVLDLPHREALALEDFLVSASNEAAVSLIDAWPNWPTEPSPSRDLRGLERAISQQCGVSRRELQLSKQPSFPMPRPCFSRPKRALVIEDLDQAFPTRRCSSTCSISRVKRATPFS